MFSLQNRVEGIDRTGVSQEDHDPGGKGRSVEQGPRGPPWVMGGKEVAIALSIEETGNLLERIGDTVGKFVEEECEVIPPFEVPIRDGGRQ